MKWSASMIAIAVVAAITLVSLQWKTSTAAANDGPEPKIKIRVTNLVTGQAIRDGSRLSAPAQFQVAITTNGVDCAGQFVVTALGAPGAPPAVLVQAVPFLIGPAVGSNSAFGIPLDSGLQNSWKISASCNGAKPKQFTGDTFEFFVRAQ